MNFVEAAESFFKKYFDFKGRSSRSEYWCAYLFILLVAAGLGFVEGMLGFSAPTDVSILASIWQLVILVPSIAIVARRLHDTNKSGWWQLIIFTIIGIIPLIYWMCKGGDEGGNTYGSNPLKHSV
jgi:uncharacterized membrane protein YhaH (DUF805 family)